MRSSIRALVVACAFALTAGCAGLQTGVNTESPTTELVVKYATLKVLEKSDSITGQEVIEHVDRVRSVVEDNAKLSLAALVQEVRGPIDWGSLSPADRLLLDALISQIEYSVGEVPEGSLDKDRRVRILTILDWVEQAAGYAR